MKKKNLSPENAATKRRASAQPSAKIPASGSTSTAKRAADGAATVPAIAPKPPAKRSPRGTKPKPQPQPPVSVLPTVVTVVARINVGWGNQVFLRGEGGGLSWEKGVPMMCLGANEWVWISAPETARVAFKFVLNDIFWEQGDDHRALDGETIVHSPLF